MAPPKNDHHVEDEPSKETRTALGHVHRRIDEMEGKFTHLTGLMERASQTAEASRTTVNDKLDRILHVLHGPHPLGEGALLHKVQLLETQIATLTAGEAVRRAEKENYERVILQAKFTIAGSLLISIISLAISFFLRP